MRVLISLGLVLLVAACRVPTVREHAAHRQAEHSADQLRQLGVSLMMYAAESGGGLYPPLAAQPGMLMFHPPAIYPEYLGDVSILRVGPVEGEEDARDPLERITDHDYIYLGYALPDLDAVRVLAEVYVEEMRGDGFTNAQTIGDMPRVLRLRQGIGRYLAADPLNPGEVARVSDALPVMLERPGLWADRSVHVLYFDGLVERVPYGKYPNVEPFWAEIARMDAVSADG